MVLVDGDRRIVDANAAFTRLLGHARRAMVGRAMYDFVSGGPLATPSEWRRTLALGRFAGEAGLVAADESVVAVQGGATTEAVTGRRLGPVVGLRTARRGARVARPPGGDRGPGRPPAPG